MSWLPSKYRVYNTSATWNQIRTHHPKMEWSKLISFKGSMPKHSFMCWLAILDRLATRSPDSIK